MTDLIAVQVPTADASALQELSTQLDSGSNSVSTVRPFDGETVAQIVTIVSVTSLPLIRAFVKLRIETRKAVSMTIDGVTLTGYTRPEAERLLERLEQFERDQKA